MREKNLPKILIISNNALSETNNNGKTISSFFEGYPKNKLRQLYFNSELPTGKPLDSYFQITDKDVLDLFLKKDSKGREIKQPISPEKEREKVQSVPIIPLNEATRLIREFIWKERWNTEKLWQWLDEFKPDEIFFVAGDSGFVYDITTSIQKRYKIELITYITDDYILPRKTISPFWWARRFYILGRMKSVINDSRLLLTISEKMRSTYKELFSKDSLVFMNLTDSYIPKIQNVRKKDYIKLIYAGGLHYNRYLVLEQLGRALKEINKETLDGQLKFKLEIYTNTKPSEEVLKKINIENTSFYKGSLNKNELLIGLNNADIPVHVESFDRKSIESTRLSLSTKILEYLSLGKPVLAIGPKEVASMEFLEDKGFCINNQNKIKEQLVQFLFNKRLQKKLGEKARLSFEEQNRNIIKMINIQNTKDLFL